MSCLNIKTTEESNVPVENIETIIKDLNPEEQVKAFFIDLVEKRFEEAHKRQRNTVWANFDRFKSIEYGYGGMTKVEFFETKILNQTENIATVYLYYYAEDPHNKSDNYHQYFVLDKDRDKMVNYK